MTVIIRDGRRFLIGVGRMGRLPTLRVCMQCGATWDDLRGTIYHVGPHDPNLREYRRISAYPRQVSP